MISQPFITRVSGPFANRAYLPWRFKVEYYGTWIAPDNWSWRIPRPGYAEYALHLAQLVIPPDQQGLWPSLSAYAYSQMWWRIFYQQQVSERVAVFNLDPRIVRWLVFIASREAWIDPEFNLHRKIMTTATVWKTFIPQISWRLWVVNISELPNSKLHKVTIQQGLQIRNTNLGQLDVGMGYLKRVLEIQPLTK